MNLFGANALDRWRMPINADRRAPVHNPYCRKRSAYEGGLFFLAASAEYRYSH
jgi:hypothetical protein